MEVQVHAFLTSALNGDERPASMTFHFMPRYEIDRGEVGSERRSRRGEE